MNTITLDFDYTLNGVVKWAKGIAHDANDELRQLLAAGVSGTETKAEAEDDAATVAASSDGAAADAGVQTSEQATQQ